MRVSIFGLGYVGCVTGAALARAGHRVIGVDVSAEKVSLINDGRSPIVEAGLDDVLREVVSASRLIATGSDVEAVEESDVCLVCVGTPSKTNGQLDLRVLERVMTQVGKALARRPKPYTVVVRSTVLPGTTEKVLIPLLNRAGARNVGSDVTVAVNPEFMREGSALRDVAHPPFTLTGVRNPDAEATLRALYEWVEAPFIATDIKTAEMVKFVSNAFHAMKVCFANEIGDLCRGLGADEQEVMRIFRLDHVLNISDAYLTPGFAFGGSCLPKDVRALLYAARGADVSVPLMAAVLPSNDDQIHRAVQTVLETRKRRIGIVGLAFKSGTDDVRESPLVALAEVLIGKGCDVRILDHSVTVSRLIGANRRYIEEEIPHIASLMSPSLEAFLRHAEVVVVGKADAEAAEATTGLRREQVLIDLTRGSARLPGVVSTGRR